MLTSLELQRVQHQTKHNLEFKFQGVRVANNDHHHFTRVLQVSDTHNLIMFKGTLHTGYEHIIARHIWWKTVPFLQGEDENQTFTKQGRFPKEISPIELLKIAESVYSPLNISLEKNKDAENVDLYIGKYKFDNREEEIYLILYKDTKVIHTMFIKSDRYRKPIPDHFPFHRGEVEISSGQHNEIYIPYIDTDFNTRYCIVIKKEYSVQMEYIEILVYKENKYNFHKRIGERSLVNFPSEKSEQISYQHGDLRQMERKIMEIDEKIKSGELEFRS